MSRAPIEPEPELVPGGPLDRRRQAEAPAVWARLQGMVDMPPLSYVENTCSISATEVKALRAERDALQRRVDDEATKANDNLDRAIAAERLVATFRAALQHVRASAQTGTFEGGVVISHAALLSVTGALIDEPIDWRAHGKMLAERGDVTLLDVATAHEANGDQILAGVIRQALGQLVASNRDAARYRWLRDGNAYAPEEEHVRGGDDLDYLCDTQGKRPGTLNG